MAAPDYRGIMAEFVILAPNEIPVLLLRLWDERTGGWVSQDQWVCSDGGLAMALGEVMTSFELFTRLICSAHGVQLELPFP